MQKKPSSKSESINFQEQFSRLEKITEDFEAGKYDLTTGLKKFEEGLQLAQTLRGHLTEVENTIETIKRKYDELTSEDQTD